MRVPPTGPFNKNKRRYKMTNKLIQLLTDKFDAYMIGYKEGKVRMAIGIGRRSAESLAELQDLLWRSRGDVKLVVEACVDRKLVVLDIRAGLLLINGGKEGPLRRERVGDSHRRAFLKLVDLSKGPVAMEEVV